MTRMTRDDVGYIAYAYFREAVFLGARIVCQFRGHKGYVWRTFKTVYGPMRERSCERCGKTESDYSALDARGKEIVGLVPVVLKSCHLCNIATKPPICEVPGCPIDRLLALSTGKHE